MDQEEQDFKERLEASRHRDNLRNSIRYIDVLLKDVAAFEALCATDTLVDEKSDAFKQLATLTLGSLTDWELFEKISAEVEVGNSTLMRWVCRHSAPHPVLMRTVAEAIKKTLHAKRAEIEAIVVPLEAAEEERQQKIEQEWQEFTERVDNPVSEFFNTVVVYTPSQSIDDSEFPLRLSVSLPCAGMYDFSSRLPLVCHECAKHGKTKAHTHGRIVLSGEDGLLLLPHIVRSQADLLQAIEDMRSTKREWFISDAWCDACKTFLLEQPVIQALPVGDVSACQPRDLSQEKLFWCLC